MDSIADIIQGHLNKLIGRNRELAERRLKICATCIFFIPSTLVCRRCGCPMEAKGTLERKKCPLGKW